MAKTRIEWCDYTLNPVKGLCPVDCKDMQGKPYCYARRMYQRFKRNPEIVFDLKVFGELDRIKKPSRIFWGSTMELFGPWIPKSYIKTILWHCNRTSQHTHIFLTKRPRELKKYNPWPDNCWVGMSATKGSEVGDLHLMGFVQAKVKFVSFEPLLEYSTPDLRWVNWVIIGQQTPAKKNIPAWWIAAIESEANKYRIPVFHKNNLGIVPSALRQEWPSS